MALRDFFCNFSNTFVFFVFFCIFFISPQSERSELGTFYFCQGVLSGYCCVCERGYYHVKKKGYCNEVGYRGSSEMSQIWVLWWHFWRLLVTVDFDDGFNTKVWSVDHIIIVKYINGVGYRGFAEMCQIWVQWSHFWRLLLLQWYVNQSISHDHQCKRC